MLHFQTRRTTNHNKDVSIFLETSMRSKTPRQHPIGWCHWDLHQIQFGEYAQHSSMRSLFTAGWTRERWQATWSIGRADGPTWLDENMVGWQPQLHSTPDAFRLQVFKRPSCEWGTWQGRRQTTCHWVAVDSRVTLARRPEDLGYASWRRRHGYLDCHRDYGLGCSDQEHAPGPHYPRLEGVHLSCTEEALEPFFSLASCDPWRTGWVWVWPV